MPFPLPTNPEYRKVVIKDWLIDAEDRLRDGKPDSALESWKIANELYLSLPPGEGDFSLEQQLFELRVKLEK
jgi:hypothetical protein